MRNITTELGTLTRTLSLAVAATVITLICGLAFPARSSGSVNAEPPPNDGQRYTGTLTYIGGPRGTTVTTFTLTIESYTPDSELVRLSELLNRSGQDALMKGITNEKHGTIQINSGLSRDLNAVWISDQDEERKITALAERWIGVGEARRGARSLDYPFTYIELFMDRNGKGEGELIPAARVRATGAKSWEIENFGVYPARLTNVRQER